MSEHQSASCDRTGELIAGGDLDELVRHIDHLCFEDDWDGLVDLRDRARRALERGRQLWPAASLAEYRLALEAPGRWAASVLVPGAGRFALGPLPEVAAQSHTWAELAPHAPPSPEATFAANERVVRGEDLSGDERIDKNVLELPLRLEPWEPDYPVAVYRADEAQFPEHPQTPLSVRELGTPVEGVVDPDATDALVELAGAWSTESNGRARAVAVDGDVGDALATLTGGAPAVRLAPVALDEALSAMAWAGASGGAHGRRRGMAAGRFGAWWALTALTLGLDRWPPAPDALGEAAVTTRWFRWEPATGPSTGWALRLAVQYPDGGRAWAVDAVDSA